MGKQTLLQTRGTSLRSYTTVPLQRKCACGQHTVAGGECAECRHKRERMIQRVAVSAVPVNAVPPIVHEVLSSPGQALDAGAQAFMEPRFGYDFSQVRVHTSGRAAESARTVNALAYTVGRDVVFNEGQYAPETSGGRRLLAHELTHVVQQGNQTGLQGKLEIGADNDQFEQEADRIATSITDKQSFTQIQASKPLAQNLGVIQRAAIYQGRILDEGSCVHLACNSRYACEDSNGIVCPPGTRNASTTKRYRPLFTCDHDCSANQTCDDHDNWMAIPRSRFASRKCNQNLVMCANHSFTHAYVRDKSDREAWEVSPGIQNRLGVSGSFTGSIYGSEDDAAFRRDNNCHPSPGRRGAIETGAENVLVAETPGETPQTTEQGEIV